MRVRVTVLCILLAGLLSVAVSVRAGEKCYTCHTMHASQNGLLVGDGPNERLLLQGSCLGCHTGTNDASHHYYVLSTADPTATMTAGGNFYWIDQGDTVANHAKGHNVSGISAADLTHAVAPGGSFSTQPMNCAGTGGCHGDRSKADEWAAMYKTHHNNGSGQITSPTTAGASYRFLKGVEGYEDTDAEFTKDAADHNEYKGVDKAADNEPVDSTISSLCGQCHEDFHNTASSVSSGNDMSSPWLRHPTDFAVNSVRDGSHPDYDGMATTYSNTAPVGRKTIANPSNVLFAVADDAIVTCISCHRAHGSPYPSILRWDYRNWPTVGSNGCNVCHTTKD